MESTSRGNTAPDIGGTTHDGEEDMGIGTSLFLLAAGAILTYAVDVDAEGVNLDTIGIILMIVGAVGVLLSLVFWGSWGGFHRRETVVDGGARRRTIVEEDV